MILLHRRVLDVLAVGDEEAATLGVNVRRVRLTIVISATIGTAAVVAVSGLIGFVGIIVPHFVRLAIGTSYRIVLPLSLLRRRRLPRALRRDRADRRLAGRAADRRRHGVLRRSVLRGRAPLEPDVPVTSVASTRSR